MKSYLLVYDPTQLEQSKCIDLVDNIDEVDNWHAFFEGAIVLVSELDARQLARVIRERASRQRFMVTELNRGTKDGWLPRQVWDFMNEPKPVSAA